MAKVTVKKVEPKEVVTSVTLELTHQEAELLQTVMAQISGTNEGSYLHPVYYALDGVGIKYNAHEIANLPSGGIVIRKA